MIVRISMINVFICLFVLLVSVQSQTISYYQTGEEFAGPFASWKNIKTDFGANNAKGDGLTDDAAAISAALTSMKNANNWIVLYFPAGTYIINSTTLNTGRVDQENMGLSVVGEDPATTVIKCSNGFTSSTANQGAMMILDATYGNISRITFDGNNKATVGLLFDGIYATDWRVTDMVFANCRNGLQFGGNSDLGKDLSAVERCVFQNCGTGLRATNYNTLGPYAWYCIFNACSTAINNGGGFIQSTCNVFLGSKTVDITSGTNGYAIMNNISIGSRRFTDPPNGSCVRMANNNKIYNTTMTNGLTGTDVMLDNIIRSSGTTGPAMSIGPANCLMVGNTFTVSNPYTLAARTFRADQKIVDQSTLPVPTSIPMPGVPQNFNRKVFEITQNTGNDATEIQNKIIAAASDTSTNPVVHFPKGNYSISRTIVIPKNKAMQLVGDGGGLGGVRISWTGTGTGPGFKLLGPSRVTMKNFFLGFTGSNADIMFVDSCDQAGGRVYMNQTEFQGNTAATPSSIDYYIDSVENADVTILNAAYTGNADKLIFVQGGPVQKSGGTTSGQVSFLYGYYGNQTPSTISLIDGGRLTCVGMRNENRTYGLTTLGANAGGGNLTWANCQEGVGAAPFATPEFICNNFNGTLCNIANYTALFSSMTSPKYRITGDGSKSKILSACNWDPGRMSNFTVDSLWRDQSSPAAQAALLNCMAYVGPSTGSASWQNQQNISNKVKDALPDTQFVLSTLQQLRDMRIEPPNNRAAGVTDVKLIRVLGTCSQGKIGITIRGGLPSGQGVRQGLLEKRQTSALWIGKIMPMSAGFHMISAGIKQINVYNLHGQCVLSKNINSPAERIQTVQQIQSFVNNEVVIVKAH